MKTSHLMLAALVSLTLIPTPSPAQPPPWAGGGKGKDHAAKGKGTDDRAGGKHFRDENRVAVRRYYAEEFGRGSCPPGLAKKNNACMPPGQAKKWNVGQPVPAGVQVYEIPRELVVRIGPPPAGHKYVRVASDVLLIATGTNMVVDAIRDLGRR